MNFLDQGRLRRLPSNSTVLPRREEGNLQLLAFRSLHDSRKELPTPVATSGTSARAPTESLQPNAKVSKEEEDPRVSHEPLSTQCV